MTLHAMLNQWQRKTEMAKDYYNDKKTLQFVLLSWLQKSHISISALGLLFYFKMSNRHVLCGFEMFLVTSGIFVYLKQYMITVC